MAKIKCSKCQTIRGIGDDGLKQRLEKHNITKEEYEKTYVCKFCLKNISPPKPKQKIAVKVEEEVSPSSEDSEENEIKQDDSKLEFIPSNRLTKEEKQKMSKDWYECSGCQRMFKVGKICNFCHTEVV